MKTDVAQPRAGVVSSPEWIAFRLLLKGKFQYLPLPLSDYGREILVRKYDAIATDRAYFNKPNGFLGPIGYWIDYFLLNTPFSKDLRERLEIVSQNLVSAINEHQLDDKIKVLSAPCGVIRDCLTTYNSLTNEVKRKIKFIGLDNDIVGDILLEAERRAKKNNLPVTFIKQDLFKFEEIERRVKDEVAIINCINFTAWTNPEDLQKLIQFFYDRLLAGGYLILDNFYQNKYSAIVDNLDMHMRYHDENQLEKNFKDIGFLTISKRLTANKVNAVYILKKAHD